MRQMTPKKAKPAAGARAGDVKGLPVKRGKTAQGGSKRAQHGQKGVEAESRGQRAGSQKGKAKRKVKGQAGAGRSARITLEAKPVKVKPWEASQALPDGQQERFCQLMADGRYSQRSCYAQAYGCENDGTARTNGSRLLTNANICARIAWLRDESLKNWKCEKEEVMRFLHQVITTPVGYVDEESPLAQEVQREEMQMGGARGQLKRGQAESGNEEENPPVEVTKVKIKTPGKVEAAKLLAQMQGWDKSKDDPMSKAVDTMAEMVRMIREGKKA